MGSLIKMLVPAVFLMLGSTADGQLCSTPVNNIPQFQDQGRGNRIPLPLDRLQVVIPAYTFTCHGRVVQWGACIQRGGNVDNDRYDIDFQVLRPSPVSDPDVDCYSLVGSNVVDNGQPDDPVHQVDHCIVYDVPVDRQFLVQPGDVVGFFSDHINREDNNGVQVVESREDVTVHYRVRDDIPSTSPGSCMFVVGPGQIDSVTIAAPVITAIVESVTPTTSSFVFLSPVAPLFTSLVHSTTPPVVVTSPTPPVTSPSPPIVVTSPTPPVVVSPVPPSAIVTSPTPPVVVTSPTPPAVVVTSPTPPVVVSLVPPSAIVTSPTPPVVVTSPTPPAVVSLVPPSAIVTSPTPPVVVTSPTPPAVVSPVPPSAIVTSPTPPVVVTSPTPPAVVSPVAPSAIVTSPTPPVVVTSPAPPAVVSPVAPSAIVTSPTPPVVVSPVAPSAIVTSPTPPAVVSPVAVVTSQAPPSVVSSQVPPGVVSSPTPPLIGGASVPVVQGPSPTASQPPTPPNTGSSAVAIIAGTVTGSSIFILLIIIGAILVRIRQRKQKQSSLFKIRMTAFERSVIVNEAYVTNTDVIPSAWNRAYGVVELEDMNSSNKENITDHTYESIHLSAEHGYDYIH